MVTLTSMNQLVATQQALNKVKKDYPSLFSKLEDMVNLTRALQFKYQYMERLILDEDPGEYTPKHVYASVLRLYKKELKKLKDDMDFNVIKQIFIDYRSTGSSKICLLVLGKSPELLVGSSSIS